MFSRLDFGDDSGTSTVEYALLFIVAAALTGILLAIVNSSAVSDALSALIERALSP
ncbi:hypothetical protein Acsp05_46050 [Actinokineospora sp. NBRC 105648]|nr:hypothetical protein Acsp05_46050 [Actinokineospora sp. NBRC 105648]